MFISRLLQVVIILIYLFNLLTVACSQSQLPLTRRSRSTSVVSREYQLILDCSQTVVEITNKRVRTTKNWTSSHTFLKLETAHHFRHGIGTMNSYVTILGSKSQKYLCINTAGKLITRHIGHPKSCVFEEQLDEVSFTKFRSVLYPDLHLGFMKGKAVNIRKRQKKKGFCNRFTKHWIKEHPDKYNEKG